MRCFPLLVERRSTLAYSALKTRAARKSQYSGTKHGSKAEFHGDVAPDMAAVIAIVLSFDGDCSTTMNSCVEIILYVQCDPSRPKYRSSGKGWAKSRN